MLVVRDRVDSSQYVRCYEGEFPVTSLLSLNAIPPLCPESSWSVVACVSGVMMP